MEKPKPPLAPTDSAVTRAAKRLTALPEYATMEPAHRMAVVERIGVGRSADILLGLPDDDLIPFLEHLKEQVVPTYHHQSPPQQYQTDGTPGPSWRASSFYPPPPR
jgi:hypothetical protein